MTLNWGSFRALLYGRSENYTDPSAFKWHRTQIVFSHVRFPVEIVAVLTPYALFILSPCEVPGKENNPNSVLMSFGGT